ncbi:DNA alkylation repair protein [Cytobacillus sp. Hm23]
MPSYSCPSCQARSRFNMIDQVVTPVKINLENGEVEELNNLEPFHLQYNGPARKLQCASCGLIEDEQRFIKMAEHFQNEHSHSPPSNS